MLHLASCQMAFSGASHPGGPAAPGQQGESDEQGSGYASPYAHAGGWGPDQPYGKCCVRLRPGGHPPAAPGWWQIQRWAEGAGGGSCPICRPGMFDEARQHEQSTPLGQIEVRSFDEFLLLLNGIMTTARGLSGCENPGARWADFGFPINTLLNWPMATGPPASSISSCQMRW